MKGAGLEIFIAADWVQTKALNEITEAYIKKYVRQRIEHKCEFKNMSILAETPRKVNKRMSIHDPEDRVWSLQRDYIQAFCAVGYGYAPDPRPISPLTTSFPC